MRYIDSHTHIYFRGPEDLRLMSEAGIEGVVVCSYFPVKPTGCSTLVDLFRWVTAEELSRLKGCGITGKAAVGIHPRSIPDIGVDEVLDYMASLFENEPGYVLGEVGLDLATKEEEEVLKKQITLAKEYDIPMIFHTPRKNKEEVFQKLVTMIKEEKLDAGKIVIDHLTAEQMPSVREIGANAGITVQHGKLIEEDAARIVSSFGSDKVLINSDLGNVVSDPLTLPKVANYMRTAGIGEKDIEKVVYKNAKELFKF